MSQHDYNIANGGGAAVRADINNALLAVLSQNSGATAPTTTKPFMFWYDSANTVLKMRNPADSGWLTVTDTGGAFLAGVADGSVNSAKLANDSVTTSKILNANVTAAKLDGGQSGSAPIYGARAWVNFNGTGTVAIRASGNVSSITDLAVGKYAINMTTAMPDANYSAVAMIRADSDYAPTVGQPHDYSAQSASVLNIKTGSSGAAQDSSIVTVAIFR